MFSKNIAKVYKNRYLQIKKWVFFTETAKNTHFLWKYAKNTLFFQSFL